MIETIAVRHNPVTLWERYALDLTFGSGPRQFSVVEPWYRAEGNFWEMRFTMQDTWLGLWDFFGRALDREVVAYDTDGDIAFEGFIQQMELTTGSMENPGRVWTISLDQVSNRVTVRYNDISGNFQRSETATDAASIARFGDRDMPISGGQLTATSVAEAICEQIVYRKAWPKPIPSYLDLRPGASSTNDESRIEVLVYGWMRKWGNQVYNQTVTAGVQASSAQIADINAAVGDYVKATRIRYNGMGVSRVYNTDRTALDIGFDIARLGDTLSPPMRWLLYMDVGRTLVFEPAASPINIEET